MYRRKKQMTGFFSFGQESSFFPKKKKVGIAFSDFVSRESGAFTGGRRDYGSFYKRSGVLSALPIFLLSLAFIVLFIRLFYVNIVQGAYYTRLSNENRTRTELIPAARGIIFDRNNKPLVRNVPVFEVLDEKGKIKVVEKEEALALISEGKAVRNSVAREYLYKDVFAHVLGYTGQISEDELLNSNYKGYDISDTVGKMGLEREYEEFLHGENGKKLFEVNALGEKIRPLGTHDAISGQNLETTLDVDIQLAARSAMTKVDRGAVVVTDPRNGGILALYSKPSFDANVFTHAKSYKAEGKYDTPESIVLDSVNQPLLDRAISGVYPPGSTYKLITSVAGLETKAITEDTEFEDTGVIKVGGASFGTWNFLQNGKTEGQVDLVKALARSNDIYFYRASEKIGVAALDEFSKMFGLGAKTGIDLPGETVGTVPSEKWKKRVLGEDWYLGDTYNMSIGQGYLETTPLQVNMMTQLVAADGKVYKPHIKKGEEEMLTKAKINPEYLAIVRTGMKEVCETGGTAYPLFDFKVKNDQLKIDGRNYTQDSSGSAKMVKIATGCKTGTAEAHGLGEPDPHAWFTIFAPFYNPEIVITVLVENGGEGSSVASPIAKEILTKYFEKK